MERRGSLLFSLSIDLLLILLLSSPVISLLPMPQTSCPDFSSTIENNGVGRRRIKKEEEDSLHGRRISKL
jgi:hypothetical protein